MAYKHENVFLLKILSSNFFQSHCRLNKGFRK